MMVIWTKSVKSILFVSAFGFVCLVSHSDAGAPVHSPMPLPSAVVPAASPVPAACNCQCPGDKPVVPALSKSDSKKLLSEFQKAQKSEMSALVHRQKLELRELKASQNARHKEWENTEREARHKFFKEHSQGAERRAYVQDFIERRKALLSLLNEERNSRTREQDVRRKAIKDDQSQKLKEFKEQLSRGVRPSERLWPDKSF